MKLEDRRKIMRGIKFLAIVIIMAGLTACEKEIMFSDIAPEPLLVVNGVQHVGEPARINVEKSSFYINTETDFRVKDVHVDLYVNGTFKEALQVRDSVIMESYWVVDDEWGNSHMEERPRYAFNYCEGTYLLCEGDAIRFEVSSSEFDEVAVAETTMPGVPQVVSFDTIRVVDDDSEYGGRTVYFALTVDDPVGNDYYNLYPQYGMEGFQSGDPVFADVMNIVQVDDLFGDNDYYGRGAYNVFNDTYFDGTTYAVNMSVSVYMEDGQYVEPFVLEVSKVDYGLYQFKKSYTSYESSGDGMLGLFTEPTQVYSNVKNGVGVVCSQSQPVIKVVDLHEIF